MNEKTIAAIALSNRDFPSLTAKLDEAARWVRLAGKQGAELAVLPELLNAYYGDGAGGKRPSHADLAFDDWQASCRIVLDAAREAEIAVVVPVLERVGDGRVSNCFYLVEADGSVVGRYGKMFPTPEGLRGGEIAHEAQPLMRWRGLKVGGAICFDTCFEQTFAAQADADLLVVPSLWPGGKQLEQAARQYNMAVALAYPAWSRVIDFAGREVAGAGYRHETLRFGFGSPIALATINFDRVALYGNHNQQKIVDIQESLGDQVRISFDQLHCTFHLESRSETLTADDVVRRFGLISHADYFDDCLRQRNAALANPTQRVSPVVSVRRLVADGRHNAFTSMIEYRGQLYLTHRTGSGHGIPDGDVAMLRSADRGETWEPVDSPACKTHAFYEGHLCELNGRLLMFSGTFRRGGQLDKSTQQQWVSWTDDGQTWHGPEKVFKPGWRFWQPLVHEGTLYVAAYRVDYTNLASDGTIPAEAWYVRLLRSGDGLNWDDLGDLSTNEGGNETELYMDENNIMHAYIRSGVRPNHLLHRSAAAPYTEWSASEDCGFNSEGQQVRQINGRLFLAGRHRPSNSSRTGTIFDARDRIRTRIWVRESVREHDYWVEYAELPSGADTSYPAMVRLDDRHMLMSYYSQHAYLGTPDFKDMDGPSDIYLAVVRTDVEADWGLLSPTGQRALRERDGVDLGAGII